MRILYGVVGEGMGHATRSKVILEHLIHNLGHEVQIVVSGRAHGFLTRAFPNVPVHEIAGLKMVYEDNAVRRVATALQVLRSLPAYAENFETFQTIYQSFRPQLCISDFETFAYLYAKQHDLPVLSIDNMQVINRCAIRKDLELPKELEVSFQLTKAIVKAKLPRCDHYLITSFFFPPVRKKRTTLFPPILREEVLAARQGARYGSHVLVYQTAENYEGLLDLLNQVPEQTFLVYGYKRNQDLGNVTLKDFSETGFIADLASAKGVIAGGGYSLLGEAIYLGKPVLSLPLTNQFEQTLNALYVRKLGYGEYCAELTVDRVRGFLQALPKYQARVSAYKQDGNREILAALEKLLKEIQKKGRLL